MDDLGGLAAYQAASLEGEAEGGGFDASLWVVTELLRRVQLKHADDSDVALPSPATADDSRDHLCISRAADRSAPSLRLLDVGAIRRRYQTSDDSRIADLPVAIDLVAIDLRSDDPGVREIDFFDFVSEHGGSVDAPEDLFDVVVLSLVVNFVPDPRKRGDMLRQAASLLRPGGLLFLALPLACVENSRYCRRSLLAAMLKVCCVCSALCD